MNRKTFNVLLYLAVPASALVHGLVSLTLCALVQALSGGEIGVLGFALPTIVATIAGAFGASVRLDGTDFE